MASKEVVFSFSFQFWLQSHCILKNIMANDILIRNSPSIKGAETSLHNYYKKNDKALKENSTINVRSQGRSQRHYKGAETKGTEIKRFILEERGRGKSESGWSEGNTLIKAFGLKDPPQVVNVYCVRSMYMSA